MTTQTEKIAALPQGAPAAPVMALLISELMLESRGQAKEMLQKFCSFFSSRLGGAGVSVFEILNSESPDQMKVVVRGSSHDQFVVSQNFDLNDHPYMRPLFETRKTFVATDAKGELSCPVFGLGGSIQKNPIGFLLIEPFQTNLNVIDTQRYFHLVAQCLYGTLAKGPISLG